MPPPITTRRATPADIDAINSTVQSGFDSYVEFAPVGWEPPKVASWSEQALSLLHDPGTWAMLALVDDRPVGHVSFFPGREPPSDLSHRSDPPRDPNHGSDPRHDPNHRSDPPRDPSSRSDPLTRPLVPGLAHLWQLFVLPEWWGQGVAPMLHDLAIAEMRTRGYEQGRLFTPSLQARARRFYERRDWSLAEERWNDAFQLMMCEYRIPLTA